MSPIRDSELLRKLLAKWGAFVGILVCLFFIAGFFAVIWQSTSDTISSVSFIFALILFMVLWGHILQFALRITYFIQYFFRFLWRAHIPPYTTGSITYRDNLIVPNQRRLAVKRLYSALFALMGWWLVTFLVGSYLISVEPEWVSALTSHWTMQIILAVSAVLLRIPIAIADASPFSLPAFDQYQSGLFILLAISGFPSAAVAGSLMQIYEEHLKTGLGLTTLPRPETDEELSEFEAILQIVLFSVLFVVTLLELF